MIPLEDRQGKQKAADMTDNELMSVSVIGPTDKQSPIVQTRQDKQHQPWVNIDRIYVYSKLFKTKDSTQI